MSLNLLKQKFGAIFLALVVLTILISHTLYVFESRQYPQWDEHHYLYMATQFYDILSNPTPRMLSEISKISQHRQPLYPMLITFFLFIFGREHAYRIALLLNGVLYAVTLLSVYALSKKYLSRVSSVMAVCIAAFYGNSLFFLHFSYSETALTTFVMLALVALSSGNIFIRKKESVIAGTALALSWLVKWIAPAFLLLPSLYSACLAIYQSLGRKKKLSRIIGNIALCAGIAVAIPLIIYYIPNMKPFLDYVWRNRTYGHEWVATYRTADMANTFSVRSLMYYLNIISQNTFFLFALFVWGMIVMITHFKKFGFILVAFLSQYIFLTVFTVWKEDRYAVSMYPLMAIITASIFDTISQKKLRITLMCVTVLYSFLIFLGASWGLGPFGKQGLKDIVLPEFIHHPRRIYLTPLVWPPNVEYVNAHQLVEIAQEHKKAGSSARILQLFIFEPWDNAVDSIRYYGKQGLFTLERIENIDAFTAESIISNIHAYDFILIKNDKQNAFIDQLLIRNTEIFRRIPVPIDNSEVIVYKVLP